MNPGSVALNADALSTRPMRRKNVFTGKKDGMVVSFQKGDERFYRFTMVKYKIRQRFQKPNERKKRERHQKLSKKIIDHRDNNPKSPDNNSNNIKDQSGSSKSLKQASEQRNKQTNKRENLEMPLKD